ncbi:MAG TPA: anti-sigma regulatory factor [Longimicrobiaceae bacterium]|nr:anti-sigma regulatory factor [Longimicrobiaceae bacterium]
MTAMTVTRSDERSIRAESDVVTARQAVRAWAVEMKFSLVEQTKLVTAASELARNTLVHGGGGVMRMEMLEEPPRRGLRLVFEDRGPGIADVEQALRDGFTTGTGLGLGLGGSRRLVDEFELRSAPGEGTRVVTVKWK